MIRGRSEPWSSAPRDLIAFASFLLVSSRFDRSVSYAHWIAGSDWLTENAPHPATKENTPKGGRPVEKLGNRNISITMRLDTATTPMLLKVEYSGKLQPN